MFALFRLALTIVASCVFTVSTARAQSVALELSGCAAPPAADVRAIAALELRGRLVTSADAAADVRVSVHCADDRAELRSNTQSELRVVELGSVPAPPRARLLALSIAELSSVSRMDSASAPPSQSSETLPIPPAPTQPPPTRSVPPPVAERFSGWLVAGATLRVAPTWAVAGALSGLVHLVGPLSWTGELALGQARHDIDGGRLRVRSLVLSSGPALVLSRAWALWYAGLAVRVELLELVGEPHDRTLWRGEHVRTFVAGPQLFAGVALPLARHLTLVLQAELAHQLRAVEVQVLGGRPSTLSPWRAALEVLVGAQW